MKNDISVFRSTQEMVNPEFELYHYREPYFRPLDFHAHEFYEAYLFLDGSVTYYIEDRVYHLCGGDLLIIPPGRMHRPVIEEQKSVYERMVLWLNVSYLRSGLDTVIFPNLSEFGGDGGYLLSFTSEELSFAMSLLTRISSASPCYQKSLIAAFLCHACEVFKARRPLPAAADSLIPAVIRYLNENFTRPLTLDEISAEFFLSKFYLSRRFKEYTNASVYDYILAKRVALARRLMRDGMAAGLASEQCGFSDYSNFYKTFVGKTGVTPKAFRLSCNSDRVN